jgi:hypothetical protein
MKTLFEHGGPNTFNGAKSRSMIQLDQTECKRGLFTVTYGLQQKRGLGYRDAAKELGECILHMLACKGDLNNDGVY